MSIGSTVLLADETARMRACTHKLVLVRTNVCTRRIRRIHRTPARSRTSFTPTTLTLTLLYYESPPPWCEQEKDMSAEKDKHLANGYKKAKAEEETLSKELVKVRAWVYV